MNAEIASTGPTFLSLISLLTAFAAMLVLGPWTIGRLHVLKFGQNINDDAPAAHQAKQGTPTMGGVLIVAGVLVSLLIYIVFLGPPPTTLWAVLVVFVAHAALGFTDDLLKARRGKSLGLKARQKLAGQVTIALAFVIWLYLTARPNFTTEVYYWHGASLDFGYLYYLFVVVLMVGMSNATNLTDGLDGLAGGLAILTALGLSLTVYNQGDFCGLPWFGYALAGACIGFLWFNAHPAKVFMGDTGSLALGSSFTAVAVLGKQELILLLLGVVFLLETLSVIIQVAVFKATGGRPNGRRVFKMTPIHHHFELSGWAETQVVARFWILGMLALVTSLLLASNISFLWNQPR